MWLDGEDAALLRQRLVQVGSALKCHQVINIVLVEMRVVKLLDLGIAKLISGRGGPGDVDSETGSRWMTPRYASPEQIEGQAVTTATDVHALGLLLFEMLCGGSPFAGLNDGSAELRSAITQRAVTPPSVSVRTAWVSKSAAERASTRGSTPTRLAALLAGDLDAIVLKALRKDPAQRYATADALLDDLRRYEKGLPVDACEPTLSYQLSKFAGRHRMGVVAGAGIMATLLAGTVVLSVERAETLRERDRANASAATATREAEKAQAVVAFLGDVFRSRDPSQAPSDTITALQLVEWGESRLDEKFGDQPGVMTELLEVLGGTYVNLGLPARALPLLERSVALRRVTYGERSQETADGLLRLASHHNLFRSFDDGLAPAREAL